MSELILWILLLPIYIMLGGIWNEIHKRNKTFNTKER